MVMCLYISNMSRQLIPCPSYRNWESGLSETSSCSLNDNWLSQLINYQTPPPPSSSSLKSSIVICYNINELTNLLTYLNHHHPLFRVPYTTVTKSTDLVTVWTATDQLLTKTIKHKQLTLHTYLYSKHLNTNYSLRQSTPLTLCTCYLRAH